MKHDHNRILATAARTALVPLGFRQKGRSRVWLADRSFWLSIVEFQPSSFGKGSYLNVAAHWLWSATPDVLSLDYNIERKKAWVRFDDVAQFETSAKCLAQQAAKECQELQVKITGIRELASLLVEEEGKRENSGRGGGWPAFHAAIAVGIIGDAENARTLFKKAHDSIGAWRPDLQILLVPYGEALKDAATFATFIARKVNEQRSIYGLSPLARDWANEGMRRS